MKKISTLAIALLIAITSFSQQFEKVYQLQVGKYNQYSKTWDWQKAESVDLRFNMEGNFVRINDEYGTRIWTYEDLGETGGYDTDGDRYKKHTWKAYDEKNRRCNFVMLWYTTIRLVVYTISYSDIAFRYYISTESEL